jgi:1-acyl-sn-glycerol-3-phosphate acyltransferase
LLDFKPPKDSPFVIALVKLLLPAIMKVPLHDTRVEVVGDGLERFRALNGVRTVICPNHANHDDPEVMFAFSNLVGQDFNFLAAREIFEWEHGWRGFWLQKLGCYSIVRGAVDRESFKMTKSLIAANKKKLVIFPEGEVSRQNDTLLHLETGVPQMAFWAVDELAKKQQMEPVFIVPLALKYTYRDNIRDELERSLYKLEERIGLRSSARDPLYQRLSAISGELLVTLEHEYNVKAASDASRNDRIIALRLAILKNIASFLQIDLPLGQSQLEYVRILRNALDDYIYDSSDEEVTAYQKKLHDEKTKKIKGFYRDLDRVVTFIAIYDGYLREHLTQERFAEVLDRFEMEVFGKRTVKGARRVFIDVGRPIDLLPLYADYKAARKAGLQKVTDDLGEQISTMLDALDKKRPAVFVE